jgi:hypothetical protein
MTEGDPEAQETENPAAEDPGYAKVFNFMTYSLSLPERAIRTGSGVVGGAIRESAALLVPQAFQDSTSYDVMVSQMLNFLTEDIGGVAKKKTEDEADPEIENFVARKAVGNFIELAGLATMHLSPMIVLAVVSDVAYGSKAYLTEVADELKKQGVIDENSSINGVNDLLEAVSRASSTTAHAFNTPPLSVDGLKKTIDDTREAVSSIDPIGIIPKGEIERMWKDMHDVAGKQNVGVMEVSSAMTLYALGKVDAVRRGALSTVMVTGRLFDRHIIDHYRSGLADIGERGIYTSLSETSKPYVEAVWSNFSTDKSTITEDLVTGRLIGKGYSAMRRWLGGSEKAVDESDGEHTAEDKSQSES